MTQQSHFFQAWPPIDARRLSICPNGRQFAGCRRYLWQEKRHTPTKLPSRAWLRSGK